MRAKTTRQVATGLGFLAPNILGFLTFTLVPLVISFLMAFTNWDVHMHNMFREEPLRFAGLENFRRLFEERQFLQYFGNTLFFMMGIPFGIAGSLGAALLLSRDLRPKRRSAWARGLCTAVLIAGLAMLVAAGCGATATVLLVTGLAGCILVAGTVGGKTVYRTVFYSPHFTAGVATFLLWKKLYNPYTGPINLGLVPVLDRIETAVESVSAVWLQGASHVLAGAFACLLVWSAVRFARNWQDGEAGIVSLAISLCLLALPVGFALAWAPTWHFAFIMLAGGAAGAVHLALSCARARVFTCRPDYGLASNAMLAAAVMTTGFITIGLGNVVFDLPAMAADGLEPPQWLTRYHWAKPSLMIMGLWAAVGSNNMLLYLAGLSNIPPELYEAADIDGAAGRQRFLHVTWPQLAPITFFIVVMSVIGGLQGGFEMARTMTGGGPAGATTTLSYYIYSEGFQAGRLGYASAVAWALFVLVLAVTLFNWKFGNRYTNE